MRGREEQSHLSPLKRAGWLSTARLTLAHAIIDGRAYLAVIMGLIGGGIKTLFSENSN